MKRFIAPAILTTFYQLKKCMFRIDVLLCLLCAAVFLALPSIDLFVTNQFYDGAGFPLNQHIIVIIIYEIFAYIQFPLSIMLLLSLAALYCIRHQYKPLKKRLRFLCLALLIGPGLVVNLGFKDNSFGRPRPVHIEEFGGPHQFAPILTYSGQCHRNCSFVSGHAALGFYFMALGWVLGSRAWFLAGVALGILVGGVRVVQGGHFISDVIFSFWSVYFVCLILGNRYQYGWKNSPQMQNAQSN